MIYTHIYMHFDPSITSLRALCSLANTGSVSLTAVELGLTQSAVSRSISSLEQMVGLTLVQRSVRPLKLTKEGVVVAAHGNDINLIITSLGERISDLRRNEAGAVRIGSFGASASTRLLPPLIKAFSKRFPAISVNIIEANDVQTLENLQRGLVDLAFLADPGENFETIPVATDELVALVPANSKLASYDVLNQSDLVTEPFIMTQGGSENYILEWFRQANTVPNITHRVLQAHSILALVRENLGNAIVARLSLPHATAGVRQVSLFKAKVNRLVLARKYQTPYSKAAELFWKSMLASINT